MPDSAEKSEHTRTPFPTWARELMHIIGLVLALAAFAYNLKSDQRSTREELSRVSSDIAATRQEIQQIRELLPSKEVLDIKLKDLDDKIASVRDDLKFEVAKAQKFREDLLRKGVID